MKLIPIMVAALLAAPCYAQTGGAQVFSGKDVNSQMAILVQKAKASSSGGAKLADYGSHSIQLSVRTSSGGAEVHAHYDDIFVVTKGRATLITGGSVMDAKTSPDGETKGTGIRNGHTQLLQKGDIVNIPAGTPHQLKIAPGQVYASIVIKVKEAK